MRISFILSNRSTNRPFYSNHLIDLYLKDTDKVTLRQLIVYGRSITTDKLIKSANYVRTQLPIRLAHRIRDFQNLPFVVGTNPYIEHVYHLYWKAFELFRTYPEIKTLEENQIFCKKTNDILLEHVVTIPQIILGISETSNYLDKGQADSFMTESLRSRIGRRVLAEQHVALTDAFMLSIDDSHWDNMRRTANNTERDFLKNEFIIGTIHSKCNPTQIIQKTHLKLVKLFEKQHNLIPSEIIVHGHQSISFPYIPDHLEYIIFSLLKNAMYHTIAHHSPESLHEKYSYDPLRNVDFTGTPTAKPNLPPIEFTLAQDKVDGSVVIRITDQGGGIAPEILDNIWSFSHLNEYTLSKHYDHLQKSVTLKDDLFSQKMNLGLGLNISRAYANYWGGTIQIYSMAGYGTDVYLKIQTSNQIVH